MGSSYLVEVKPSVFSETTLIPHDFDQISNLSTKADQFDDRLTMAFRSREGAEEWVNSLEADIYTHRIGRLHLQSAHQADGSEVDAYLMFKPRS
jgi:hypothetical protein